MNQICNLKLESCPNAWLLTILIKKVWHFFKSPSIVSWWMGWFNKRPMASLVDMLIFHEKLNNLYVGAYIMAIKITTPALRFSNEPRMFEFLQCDASIAEQHRGHQPPARGVWPPPPGRASNLLIPWKHYPTEWLQERYIPDYHAIQQLQAATKSEV